MSRFSFLAEESAILVHAAVLGLEMGLVYDFFRVLRRSFRCKFAVTAIMDLLYWCFVGYRTFYIMHTYSNGELRWFAVLGAITVLALYMKVCSKCIVAIGTWLLVGMKSIAERGKNLLTRNLKMPIIKLRKDSKERE
jgi:spore cortex biosynthesis protein YabQ